MIVAQLVEWSLPIPEVGVLNPVIGKLLYSTFLTVNCKEKTKIKKKRREWPILIKITQYFTKDLASGYEQATW